MTNIDPSMKPATTTTPSVPPAPENPTGVSDAAKAQSGNIFDEWVKTASSTAITETGDIDFSSFTSESQALNEFNARLAKYEKRNSELEAEDFEFIAGGYDVDDRIYVDEETGQVRVNIDAVRKNGDSNTYMWDIAKNCFDIESMADAMGVNKNRLHSLIMEVIAGIDENGMAGNYQRSTYKCAPKDANGQQYLVLPDMQTIMGAYAQKFPKEGVDVNAAMQKYTEALGIETLTPESPTAQLEAMANLSSEGVQEYFEALKASGVNPQEHIASLLQQEDNPGLKEYALQSAYEIYSNFASNDTTGEATQEAINSMAYITAQVIGGENGMSLAKIENALGDNSGLMYNSQFMQALTTQAEALGIPAQNIQAAYANHIDQKVSGASPMYASQEEMSANNPELYQQMMDQTRGITSEDPAVRAQAWNAILSSDSEWLATIKACYGTDANGNDFNSALNEFLGTNAKGQPGQSGIAVQGWDPTNVTDEAADAMAQALVSDEFMPNVPANNKDDVAKHLKTALKNNPEFASTIVRADGTIDMVVLADLMQSKLSWDSETAVVKDLFNVTVTNNPNLPAQSPAELANPATWNLNEAQQLELQGISEYIGKGNANGILTELEKGNISPEVAIIALYNAAENAGVDPGDVAGLFRKMSNGNEEKHLQAFFGLFQNYGFN